MYLGKHRLRSIDTCIQPIQTHRYAQMNMDHHKIPGAWRFLGGNRLFLLFHSILFQILCCTKHNYYHYQRPRSYPGPSMPQAIGSRCLKKNEVETSIAQKYLCNLKLKFSTPCESRHILDNTCFFVRVPVIVCLQTIFSLTTTCG